MVFKKKLSHVVCNDERRRESPNPSYIPLSFTERKSRLCVSMAIRVSCLSTNCGRVMTTVSLCWQTISFTVSNLIYPQRLCREWARWQLPPFVYFHLPVIFSEIKNIWGSCQILANNKIWDLQPMRSIINKLSKWPSDDGEIDLVWLFF